MHMKKMTQDQWLASFRKYDDSTGWDRPREHPLKGGIIEHHRTFTESVSKEPDKFYDFIFDLGRNKDISIQYLAAGIEGLVKAEYDIKKIKKIIKEYWEKTGAEYRRSILRTIAHIDKEDTLDLDLIRILEEYALNDPDPEKESWAIDSGDGKLYYNGDPLSNGINTVRGSAIDYLAIHGFKTQYSDKVFEIMEQVVHDNSIAVKCCLIKYLIGMIQWDSERAINIFNSLTSDQHPKLIKYGLEFLGKIINKNNYRFYIPHLKVAMKIGERYGNQNTDNYAGQILMYAYINSFLGGKKLLKKGCRISNNVKAGAIKYSIRHLITANIEKKTKAREIFVQFMNVKDEKVAWEYNFEFKDFKSEYFNELFPILRKYSKSKVAPNNPDYYFDYLLNCINNEPEKCINLIQLYMNNNTPYSARQINMGDKIVKILIGAYNKTSDIRYKEKVLDIFDRILNVKEYQRFGLQALSEQDRG